jgi:hypothetical protein
MALYSTFQYLINNSKFSHGCYAILIVYHTMPYFITRYPIYVVRPDELSKDIGSLCLWTCFSTLLVHPRGRRPGGARVVTSYTGVVPKYAGSFGYDHGPRYCRGRRQPYPSATALPWIVNSSTFGYGVGVLKDVTGLVVHQCETFSLISGVLALSSDHLSCLTLACMNRCY